MSFGYVEPNGSSSRKNADRGILMFADKKFEIFSESATCDTRLSEELRFEALFTCGEVKFADSSL